MRLGVTAFLKYFKKEWNEKQAMFMNACRESSDGIHTNNAIESYHAAIKKRFIDWKDTRGARVDKLVYILLTRILICYEDVQFLEDQNIVLNKHGAQVVQDANVRASVILERVGDITVVADGEGALDDNFIKLIVVL